MTDTGVVVIGAGPSGSVTAALLARLGHTVELWESRNFPRHRIGESLPPRAVALLKRLGFETACDPAAFAVMEGNTAIWGSAEPRRSIFPEGYGLQVERALFDQRLVEASGLSLRHGRWSNQETRASFVVDATGAHSQFGGQRTVWMAQSAVFGYWRDSDHPAGSAANDTIIEAVPHGWVWSLRLASGLRNVTVVADRDEIVRDRDIGGFYARSLRAAPFTRRLVAHASLDRPPRLCDASWTTVERFARPGLLHVGDAGSVIDQLSSQGVYKALCSAITAAAVVNTCLRFPERRELALEFFDTTERRSFDGHAAGAIQVYRQENRWPDLPFWRTHREARHWEHLLQPPQLLPEADQLARDIESGRCGSVRLRAAGEAQVVDRPVQVGMAIEARPVVVSARVPSGYAGERAADLCRVFERYSGGPAAPPGDSSGRRLTAYLVREGVLERHSHT